MLKTLSIKDVVLIDQLELDLGNGLIALTGETGAGKSILLDALGLAIGARAERGAVRNGCDRAQVSAQFEVAANHPVLALLEELGFDAPDGPNASEREVILRRQIGVDGRSKAYINDAPASLAALKSVAAQLIEVHGQHASIGLMDEAGHLALLDQFGQLMPQVAQMRVLFADWQDKVAALDEAKALLARAGAERDYLGHVVTELLGLHLVEGEEAALDAERRALMGTEKLASALQDAKKALDGGIEQKITNASVALSRAGDLSGLPNLAQLVTDAMEGLDNALNGLAQASQHIERAGHSLDADPKRLDHVEERLFALRAAARKHNVDVAGLTDILAKAQAKLAQIDAGDAAILAAQAALKQARSAFDAHAKALSDARTAAARGLADAVMAELPALKLEKCRFQVAIETDADKPSAKGIDKVRFEIAPNPGAGFGPLSAIASGGELSRLSLALKLVLAGDDSSLSMVFDEVDQGIGGATADAVGRRLRALGQKGQVLVVTHAPQVAARAHQHFYIEKAAPDGVTRTFVRRLDDDARVAELARMLAGETITKEATAAALALMAG